MEEQLNYEPVASSDSEIEKIKVPKGRGRPRKQLVKEQDPDKPKQVQSEH